MAKPSSNAIPKHLLPYVAKQEAQLYTAIDHATWRFIMLLSKDFFSQHAHEKYLVGLVQTGVHADRIPLIEEMDAKLRKFGWQAVPIVGFIPPAIFMEFLSLAILPIACDMRNVEHLSYTPAPDIVHEAAGHAPILADPGFAKYLLSYGEIARKVIYTDKDEALYEKIRALSDIKENPRSTQKLINQAQAEMEAAYADLTEVSEATALARMGWWTFEYGLIGSMSNPKIYGAGLLSSVGESFNCLNSNEVRRIPFSMDCIHQAYDITKPQPQLFITPDFETLTRELEKLAVEMAFRQGGLKSLQKAQRAKTVTTTVLDTGIQIGGKLSEILCVPGSDEIAYLKYSGPCQLALNDEEIMGQGPRAHAQGFGTPIGKMKTVFTQSSLDSLVKTNVTLEFESGVKVSGKLKSYLFHKKALVLLSFTECTVKCNGEVLFDPSWGDFDMACGHSVVSVFGGAPDRGSYLENTVGLPTTVPHQTSNLTDEARPLVALYERVRKAREAKMLPPEMEKELHSVFKSLESHSKDWLLRFEILEMLRKNALSVGWEKDLMANLSHISSESKDSADLIARGLELI